MPNAHAAPPDATPPENRPTPLEALWLPETPTEQHYRRNHGPYPELDPGTWSLEVRGAVGRPARLTLETLREHPERELPVLLECAGHRRTELDPPVAGVQWALGALSQARWSGCSLAAVLSGAEVAPDAVEVVLWGADRARFAQTGEIEPFARSLPLEKALHPDTLLAWSMNGQPLPAAHGAPLRAVVPGWYAMDSVKWLTAIEVVTSPFRGPYQELDYRFQPLGEAGIGRRLTEMPIHSLILSPGEGSEAPAGVLDARGIAWGGPGVERVELQVDGGPWTGARLEPAAGPYCRVRWTAALDLAPGEHTLAVRAWDTAGNTQPEMPVWNRRGYQNNSIHRVRVRAAGPSR